MADNMNRNRNNSSASNRDWNDNSSRQSYSSDYENNEDAFEDEMGSRYPHEAQGSRNNNNNNSNRNNYNDYQGSSYGEGRGQQGRNNNGGQYSGSQDNSQYSGSQYGSRGYENSNGSRGQFSQGGYTGSGNNYNSDSSSQWSRDNNYSQNRNNNNNSDWGQDRNRSYGNSGMNNNSQWQTDRNQGNYGNSNRGYGAGNSQYGNQGSNYGMSNNQSGSYQSGSSMYGSSSEGLHKGKGPQGYQRSEERIKEDVHDRLTDDAHIDASNIQISVSKNEVKLSGTVDSREAKRHAEDIVESISGVSNVENLLKVSGKNNDTSSITASNSSATEKNKR